MMVPLNTSNPFIPSKPYILGILELEFSQGFTPDMSKQYYCLFPATDPDGVHVTYTYIAIPYSFKFKESNISLPDTSSLKNLGQEQMDSLTVNALARTTSATSNSKLNPCPPNTP